mmetsp:Transcript_6812/g.23761  ORF Transcript_6812/g.23761 Transcript_6812/m.23761 type:complete len:257 (-) Transcript_6812:12969-13739(-)
MGTLDHVVVVGADNHSLGDVPVGAVESNGTGEDERTALLESHLVLESKVILVGGARHRHGRAGRHGRIEDDLKGIGGGAVLIGDDVTGGVCDHAHGASLGAELLVLGHRVAEPVDGDHVDVVARALGEVSDRRLHERVRLVAEEEVLVREDPKGSIRGVAIENVINRRGRVVPTKHQDRESRSFVEAYGRGDGVAGDRDLLALIAELGRVYVQEDAAALALGVADQTGIVGVLHVPSDETRLVDFASLGDGVESIP